MKTLLSAVLMIAVSAWGQHPEGECKGDHCRYDHTYCLSGFHVNYKTLERTPDGGYTFECESAKPKPHKPKPSVKKEHDIRCDEEGCHDVLPCDGWSCTKPVPDCGNIDGGFCRTRPSKEEFHWSCLGDCAGVPEGTTWEVIPFNNDAILPQQPTKPAWIAPEYSVLDHVLQMDVLSQPDKATGDCFRGNVGHEKQIPCPDKAAVPVEPIISDFFAVHQYNAEGLEPKCPNGLPCLFVHVTSNPMASRVDASDGSLVVKLSDSEYTHLEQLRASVVEEEKRLATKYGANRANFSSCSGDISAMKVVGCFADEYEFHSQFLLIDKGGK